MADGDGRALQQFVKLLRWAAGAFGAASAIGVIVLALRAPDCIGVGISVFGAQDCTNRDAYYLLLAAAAAIVGFLCMLTFAGAYAVELLGALAFGRERDASSDDG